MGLESMDIGFKFARVLPGCSLSVEAITGGEYRA